MLTFLVRVLRPNPASTRQFKESSICGDSSVLLTLHLQSVDVKALMTYQQVFIYVIPIITNLGVLNIMVVVARIFWFEKKLRAVRAGKSFSFAPRRNARLTKGPFQLKLRHDQFQRAWFSH